MTRTHRSASIGLVLVLALAIASSGCEPVFRDMYDQARIDPYAESPLFADGQAARPLQPGVMARSAGRLADATSGRAAALAPVAPSLPAIVPGGRMTEGHWLPSLTAIPVDVTHDLLERGRERFDIYCAPCHSPVGDGDGMVVRRGFKTPPNFHTPGMRLLPDRLIYDAISNGFGAMFSYADRVTPADRWAIVAYIRALQLSQYAPVAALDAQARAALEEPGR
jgi:mono/diheme cytochrome c family protein